MHPIRIILPAIANFDIFIPRKFVFAIGKIAHPGQVILAFASRFADIAPAAKVENIVFQRPVFTRFIHQAREQLCGNNFPWVAVPLLNDVTVIMALLNKSNFC